MWAPQTTAHPSLLVAEHPHPHQSLPLQPPCRDSGVGTGKRPRDSLSVLPCRPEAHTVRTPMGHTGVRVQLASPLVGPGTHLAIYLWEPQGRNKQHKESFKASLFSLLRLQTHQKDATSSRMSPGHPSIAWIINYQHRVSPISSLSHPPSPWTELFWSESQISIIFHANTSLCTRTKCYWI